MLLMTNQLLAARFPRMNLLGIDAARTQVVLPEKTVYRGKIRSGIGGRVPRVAMQVKERRRVWNLRRQPPAGEPVAVERQSDRFELQPGIGRRDIQGSSRMDTETLVGVPWAALVLDEAHYLKNHTSARSRIARELTSAATALAQRTPAVYLLTGTPLTNRPPDLFVLLQLAGHPPGRSFLSFAKRCCAVEKTEYGWKTDGASNLTELTVQLHGTMLRRAKEDVLSLPSKWPAWLPTTVAAGVAAREIRAVARPWWPFAAVTSGTTRDASSNARSSRACRRGRDDEDGPGRWGSDVRRVHRLTIVANRPGFYRWVPVRRLPWSADLPFGRAIQRHDRAQGHAIHDRRDNLTRRMLPHEIEVGIAVDVHDAFDPPVSPSLVDRRE